MPSVQFAGVDTIIEIFENRGYEVWSLWERKQFIHKGEGADDLRAFLELLEKSGYNPVYTLQVYQHAKTADEVNSKTPNDGSYNVKIKEADANGTVNNNWDRSKISALEKRLAAVEEGVDDDKPHKLGMIGEIMEHPAIEAAAPVIITRLLDWITGKAGEPIQQPGNNYSAGASIAGIPDDNKINEAVAVLKRHDNRLGDHLKKLADIAVNKPESFKFLLTTLDSM